MDVRRFIAIVIRVKSIPRFAPLRRVPRGPARGPARSGASSTKVHRPQTTTGTVVVCNRLHIFVCLRRIEDRKAQRQRIIPHIGVDLHALREASEESFPDLALFRAFIDVPTRRAVAMFAVFPWACRTDIAPLPSPLVQDQNCPLDDTRGSAARIGRLLVERGPSVR